jgi:UDP-N-acetylglucosamine--N-acetylmuramyl-(pentapeptide) pyrophosphoryl-undecaprenol N-acetylglucosamine transferase
VCRSGAITVAELSALHIPSVLVPLPGAPHDHQTKNAQSLERAGGAVLLRDELCTGAALAERLDDVMAPDVLSAMASAAGTLAQPHAAAAIATVVLKVRGES